MVVEYSWQQRHPGHHCLPAPNRRHLQGAMRYRPTRVMGPPELSDMEVDMCSTAQKHPKISKSNQKHLDIQMIYPKDIQRYPKIYPKDIQHQKLQVLLSFESLIDTCQTKPKRAAGPGPWVLALWLPWLLEPVWYSWVPKVTPGT